MRVDDNNISGDGLSNKQLKYAYWFTVHRQRLKTILIIFLIVIDVAILLWFGLSGVKYLNETPASGSLFADSWLINWQALHQQNRPIDLQVGQVEVITTGENKYDIGVLISNPNVNWGVSSFEYYFILPGGAKTPVRKGFILPDSDRYLMELAVNSLSRSANLQLKNINWQRVRASQPLPEVDIDISDLQIQRLSGDNQAGLDVNWTATNNSAFGFWDVSFQVILLSTSGRVNGFNNYTVESLDSLEKKELSVRWFDGLPAISTARIIPLVNVYDSNSIKR